MDANFTTNIQRNDFSDPVTLPRDMPTLDHTRPSEFSRPKLTVPAAINEGNKAIAEAQPPILQLVPKPAAVLPSVLPENSAAITKGNSPVLDNPLLVGVPDLRPIAVPQTAEGTPTNKVSEHFKPALVERDHAASPLMKPENLKILQMIDKSVDSFEPLRIEVLPDTRVPKPIQAQATVQPNIHGLIPPLQNEVLAASSEAEFAPNIIGGQPVEPEPTLRSTTATNTQPSVILAKSIATQIAQSAAHGANKVVEITLDPVELGKIRMTFQASESGMNVQIVGERPEIVELMRRHTAQLQAEFEGLGYQDLNFVFSQHQQDRDPTKQGEDQNLMEETPDQENLVALSARQNLKMSRLNNQSSTNGLDLRL
jgi:hypothetical protein